MRRFSSTGLPIIPVGGRPTWSARSPAGAHPRFSTCAAWIEFLELLPVVAPPGSRLGALTPTVADELGLPPGIPLVLAGSDGVCAELGAGVLDEGQLYGYSEPRRQSPGQLEPPLFDPTRGLIVMPGSRADPRRVLSWRWPAGSALEWFGSAFGWPVYAELEHLVTQSPPGARGVQFMPSLARAGAPFSDAAARAAFLGLSLFAQRAGLTRAVLEGVALEMRWMLQAIHTFGVAGQSLHLAGGGWRSDGWCQVVANATPVPGAAGA